MDQETRRPSDTREFVALWNTAKGEHLMQRVSEALRRLSARGELPELSEAQRALLARAVQLAADPAAGPPGAVQYLEQLADGEAGQTAGG